MGTPEQVHTPSLDEFTPVVEIAHRAGEAILEIYRGAEGGSGTKWKADRTPITEADQASDRVIAAALADLSPHIPIVSEEGALPARDSLDHRRPFWLVDPLDGTKEFIKRTGEFTVNIALIRNGRPVAGVVHAPALGTTWMAGADGGVVQTLGHTTVLRVRPADPEHLTIVASRDHAGPEVKALLERAVGAETVGMGSSLKFCVIAEGRADLYFRDGPTMEWDTAAGEAVLEKAGGRVFTLRGRSLRYGRTSFRNPRFLAVGDEALPWKDLLRGSV